MLPLLAHAIAQNAAPINTAALQPMDIAAVSPCLVPSNAPAEIRIKKVSINNDGDFFMRQYKALRHKNFPAPNQYEFLLNLFKRYSFWPKTKTSVVMSPLGSK